MVLIVLKIPVQTLADSLRIILSADYNVAYKYFLLKEMFCEKSG